jgi:hypothetical protein
VTGRDGEMQEVSISELKALFFVKEHEGRPKYKERKGFFIDEARAKKVMVEFFDGEVIFGYTISFSEEGLGFFMIPGDPDSNNEKIFVVRSSTKRVKFRSKPKATASKAS